MKDIFRPNEGYRISTDGKLLYAGFIRNAIKASSTTVTDTPTKIPAIPLTDRHSLTIQNYGSVEVFIGDATVTTSTGLSLLPRAVMRIDIDNDLDVYGIVSAGSTDVRIIEGA